MSLADPVRVLVIDDSLVVRRAIQGMLTLPEIAVVGHAATGAQALELAVAHRPDVATVDLVLPDVDGKSLIPKLTAMGIRSIIITGAELQSPPVGTAAVIRKPYGPYSVPQMADDLRRAVLNAAGRYASARAYQHSTTPESAAATAPRVSPSTPAPAVPAEPGAARVERTSPRHDAEVVAVRTHEPPVALVVIGASTGGIPAIHRVLRDLPRLGAPVVIVQHLLAGFDAGLVEQIGAQSGLIAQVGGHEMRLERGHVYLAPAGKQCRVRAYGLGLNLDLKEEGLVGGHNPAVDVLFDSAARVVGARCVAALLTGMGADGARGLLALRGAGAHTIAQSQATCAVYGMPRVAIDLGAARDVLDLDKIGAALSHMQARRGGAG